MLGTEQNLLDYRVLNGPIRLKELTKPVPLNLRASGGGSSAELLSCVLPQCPDLPLILKKARPGFDQQIEQEAKLIQDLRDVGLTEPVPILGSGVFQGRQAFVMPALFGEPLGAIQGPQPYVLPLDQKLEAIEQYLEFINKCWKLGQHPFVDHQATSVFCYRDGIQVVDFNPIDLPQLYPAKSKADVVSQRTIPQLVSFFAQAFGYAHETTRYVDTLEDIVPFALQRFIRQLSTPRTEGIPEGYLNLLLVEYRIAVDKLRKDTDQMEMFDDARKKILDTSPSV